MKRAPILVFLFFLLLSFVIIITQSFRVSSAIESFLQGVFSFPRTVVDSINPFRDHTSEIERIQSENKALLSQMYDQKVIVRENEVLRSQIRDSGDTSFSLVMVPVVGKIGDARHPKTLLVQISDAKVTRGQAVVLGNNVVGVVGEIGGSQARVTTVFNSSFETVGATLESDATGVVRGAGSSMLLEDVVVGDTLSRGDMVVTQGVVGDKTLFLPASLVLGKIVLVSNNPQAAFQTAQLESLVDFADLTHVFIWTE